jgi:hypothetical protein
MDFDPMHGFLQTLKARGVGKTHGVRGMGWTEIKSWHGGDARFV